MEFGLNPSIFLISVKKIPSSSEREFDNIFLMLESIKADNDEIKRQLYVAMTRAKENLYIHLNSNSLDNITAENIERIVDEQIYLPQNEMLIHLTFKDVWLDYFVNRQHLISNLKSGDNLLIDGDQCRDLNGQPVLKFSKQFLTSIEKMKQKGFQILSD